MNRVIHFEIHAVDLDTMQKFYETVFGWQLKDMGPQMGNYRTITTGVDQPEAEWPGINGGMVSRSGPAPKGGEPVSAYVCTIEVEDIDGYMEKVRTSGGASAADKVEVPGVGWLAYATDPEGNLFGLLQTIKMK